MWVSTLARPVFCSVFDIIFHSFTTKNYKNGTRGHVAVQIARAVEQKTLEITLVMVRKSRSEYGSEG